MLNMSRERFELPRPKPPVPVQPRIGLFERLRRERALVHASVDRALHKPCLFQHANVARYRGERHREGRRQFRDHMRLGFQAREKRASRAVAKRFEHEVKAIVG